ncbi:hypothetical protein OY671_012073, partial [Metschnikowia pulcherrima]
SGRGAGRAFGGIPGARGRLPDRVRRHRASARHRWRTVGQSEARCLSAWRQPSRAAGHRHHHQRPAAVEEAAAAAGLRHPPPQRFPRYPGCRCLPAHCPWRRSGHGPQGARRVPRGRPEDQAQHGPATRAEPRPGRAAAGLSPGARLRAALHRADA